MAQYTGAEMAARARAAGAAPPLARIMGAAAMAEGGGDSDAAGDWSAAVGDYTSWGAFQINDIHGLTREQRCDLDYATQWMLEHEFGRAYRDGIARGYAGEQLARWTAMAAERPWGWQGPDAPGLDSAAANRYAAHWHALEEPMPETRTYDPATPTVAQDDDWSCSVAAAAWALQSLGIDISYPALEAEELAAYLVTRTDGLRDASGGPLAAWVAARFGLETGYDGGVGWQWLLEHAGTQPILLGARRWGPYGHWVGVRRADGDVLALANPAEGYAGIYDTLTAQQFANVGPCSAVWLGPEADMATLAQLERQVADAVNLLGYLKEAGQTARENIEHALAVEGLPDEARATLEYGALPAAQTVERGGPPAVEGA
jgi:hypothetical protein